MDDHEAGRERPGAAARPQESGAAAPGRGGRMSRQRKTAAVMRLLRGEDLETVSRSLGVTAATLTSGVMPSLPLGRQPWRRDRRAARRWRTTG